MLFNLSSFNEIHKLKRIVKIFLITKCFTFVWQTYIKGSVSTENRVYIIFVSTQGYSVCPAASFLLLFLKCFFLCAFWNTQGRAGKKGVAYSFINQDDSDIMYDLRQVSFREDNGWVAGLGARCRRCRIQYTHHVCYRCSKNSNT